MKKRQFRIINTGKGVLNLTTNELHEVNGNGYIDNSPSGVVILTPDDLTSFNGSLAMLTVDIIDNKLKFHNGTNWVSLN